MGSPTHIDNKNKDIFIYCRWYHINTIKHPINFTQSGKRFILSLHYNGSNSILFVNATKIYQFKAKDPKIKDHALPLVNIAKTFHNL